MTMWADIAPLETRALCDKGRAILNAIADLERSMATPSVRAVANRLKPLSRHHCHDLILTLDNAGLVVMSNALGQPAKANLTDAGWRMAGDRPIWHGAKP